MKSMRVRNDDIKDAIKSTKKDVDPFDKSKKMVPTEESYYTIFGKHDFIDEEGYPRGNYDSKTILAKLVVERGQETYYIALGQDGYLANPLKETITKSIKARFGIKDEFTKCSQKMFKNYIQFLKTKNEAWYTQARREVI